MIKYKVCILAAGVGVRMGNLTQSVNKAILPINQKAVISHIVEKFPKEIEIVVAVGHKKNTVIDYLSLAHPERQISYVEIPTYAGPGTGPGLSLLLCRDQIDSPFIMVTADTIVLDEIPAPDSNWFGIAPVKDPENYCTVKLQENLICEIVDKIKTDNQYAFIGLAGIKDHERFFNALDNNREQIAGEMQCSNGFKELIENELKAIGFTFFDTGTLSKYTITNKHLSGESNKFDFGKGDEFLYFVNNRVIKYFADAQIATNRCERARYLSSLTPEIDAERNHFYSYRKVEGQVLYDVVNETILGEFLDWAEKNLWTSRELDETERRDFRERCRLFYVDKTLSRIDTFVDKTGIKDQEIYINGLLVPSLHEIFSELDWESLADGVPTQIHGDLHFDNILYLGENVGRYMLLDWRQDFSGLLEYGDLYYDLAKLYKGMIVSDKKIKEGRFTFNLTDDQAFYSYDISSDLVDALRQFEKYLVSKDYNLAKVRILVGLIFLNMAPIFYQALFCSLLGVIIFWREINKQIVLVFSIGVIAVIFSWIALPPPATAQAARGFALYNGFDSNAAWFTFYGIKNFALSDPIVIAIQSYFESVPLIFVYYVLVLIALKVYVVGSLLAGAIGRQVSVGGRGRSVLAQQRMAFLMFLYLFSSFAGYLWLRNGVSLSHQAHGPLMASGLVAALFCVWATQQTQVRRLLWAPLLVLIMLAFFPRSGSIEIPHDHLARWKVGINPHSIWTAAEPLPTVSLGTVYYRPDPSEPMVRSQLYAALLGLRLKAEDAPGPPFEEVNFVWPQGGWYRSSD